MTAHNDAELKVGRSYKVPHGQELPFAGRWLHVQHIHKGGVDLIAAGGNLVRLGNGSASVLARTAEAVR